jgi:hypothetical protein
MRSANILKNTRRRKKKKKKGSAGAWSKYRSTARTEYERTCASYLYGTLGPASAVRKIDPVTGKVLAIIKSH